MLFSLENGVLLLRVHVYHGQTCLSIECGQPHARGPMQPGPGQGQPCLDFDSRTLDPCIMFRVGVALPNHVLAIVFFFKT